MQAILYKNTSDNRYLEKHLVLLKTVDITLKNETDLKTPVIVLSNGGYNQNCNYVYLPTFNRYYTVDNVSYGEQRYTLKLKRDAKASFITELLNCDCIAARSTNEYNSYLLDNQYPRLQYNNTVCKAFPTGFSKNLNFILTIAGGA